MIGEVRRTILTAILNVLKDRLSNPSDIGMLQDYHYDMAEQYYLGKIGQEQYVRYLQSAKYATLDNLQMMSLINDLDTAREQSSYRETGRADEINNLGVVQYFCVQDGMGQHIFSSLRDATEWATEHGCDFAEIQILHSYTNNLHR